MPTQGKHETRESYLARQRAANRKQLKERPDAVRASNKAATAAYKRRNPEKTAALTKQFNNDPVRMAYKGNWRRQQGTDARRDQESERRVAMGLPPVHENDPEGRKEAFLQVYRNTGVIRAACDSAGITRGAYQHWLAHDPTFAAQFNEYKQDGLDILEVAARERALTKSDNMLMFLLRHNRPEVYGDKVNVHIFLRSQAEKLAAEFGMPVDDVLAQVEEILKDARQVS